MYTTFGRICLFAASVALFANFITLFTHGNEALPLLFTGLALLCILAARIFGRRAQ